MQRTRILAALIAIAQVPAATLVAAPAWAAPAFSATFLPDTIGPGSTSTLEFTIAGDGSSSQNLAFSNTLPAGVTIAGAPRASYSPECEGGGGRSGPTTLTAPAGGSTITFQDGALSSFNVCRVRVDVTSSTEGSHINTSGDLTSSQGNSGSASDTLTVTTDRPGFTKSFSPNPSESGLRTTLTLLIDNTSNGAGAFDLAFNDTLPDGMTVASPPNASTTCTGQFNASFTAAAGASSVSFAGYSVSSSSSCQVDVDVITSAVGASVNATSELQSSTTILGPTPRSSGFASAVLQIDPVSGLLTKEFLDDPVGPGGTVQLEFTFTNLDRDLPLTDISFTDDLSATLSGLAPAGPLPTEPCGRGSTLTGTSLLTLSGASLPAEGSCTFTVSLAVPSDAPTGDHVNTTSSVTATKDGSPVVYGPATDTLFVAPLPAFTKEWTDDPVGPGGIVTLEYTITNTSASSTATDIEFVDDLSDIFGTPLPVNLPPVPNPPCGPGSEFIVVPVEFDREGLELSGGSLAAAGSPGDSCTFSVTFDVPAGQPGGTYPSTTGQLSATIESETVLAPGASDDLVVVGAPRLTKEFIDDPATAGGTVTLSFEIDNPGEAAETVTDITFTDDLAAMVAGVTATGLPLANLCGDGNGSMVGSAGDTLLTVADITVGAGETCTFSVVLAIDEAVASDTYTNTTSELAGQSLGVAVAAPAATDDLVMSSLSITKEFLEDSVVAGDSATMRITLENTGSSNVTDISFTDDLDEFITGAEAVGLPAAGCGGTASGTSEISFSGGSVAVGADCFFDIAIAIPVDGVGESHVNRTSPVTHQVGGDVLTIAGATDTLTVLSAMSLTKEFTDDPVAPGSTVNLRFVVANDSTTMAATDITFTDDLDAMLPGVETLELPANDVCGAGSTLSGSSTISLIGGSLPAGGSCTFTVTLHVPLASAAGSYLNTTSSVTATLGGEAATGDPASDVLRIVTAEFTKSFDVARAAAGDQVDLEFTITNLDASGSLSDLAFSDNLDGFLSGATATGLPSAPCGTGSTLSGSSFLTMSGGSLPASGSCTFSVTVVLPESAAPGDHRNTTSQLSSSGLPIADPASDELTLVEVSLTKEFLAAGTPGETVGLEFTLVNLDPSNAVSGLAFTDDLDAVLAGLEAQGLPAGDVCGSGSSATGTSTITLVDGLLAAGASCSFVVLVQIPDDADAGSYTNTTSALSSDGLVVGGPASDDLVVEEAPATGGGSPTPEAVALGLEVSPAGQVVSPYELSIVALTVRNVGEVPAADVVLEVDVPSGASTSTPDGCVRTGATLTCSLGTLAPGAASTTTLSSRHDVGTDQFDVRASSAGTEVDGSATVTVDGERDPASGCTARPEQEPSDVSPGDPHRGSILCLVALGVSTGFQDGTYRGSLRVSRGQLASLLVRSIDLLGLDLPQDVPDAFDDDNGSPHEAAANRLAAADIFTGVGDRRFAGGLSISRGQLAAVLVRALEALTDIERPARVDQFRDDDGTALEPEIDAAAQFGLVTGVTDLDYRPGLRSTRSQVASIVVRFLVIVGGRIT